MPLQELLKANPFQQEEWSKSRGNKVLHLQSENKLEALVQYWTGNTNGITNEITISATLSQLSWCSLMNQRAIEKKRVTRNGVLSVEQKHAAELWGEPC